MFIFQWLNNQLLKMQWLSNLVSILVNNVFGLDANGTGEYPLFIYDVIKYLYYYLY